MRTVAFVTSAALLLFLGASNVQSFLKDWGLVETAGQRVANLGQLLAAATGLGAGVGAVLNHRAPPRIPAGYSGRVREYNRRYSTPRSSTHRPRR